MATQVSHPCEELKDDRKRMSKKLLEIKTQQEVEQGD